jgi:hypothetical protein
MPSQLFDANNEAMVEEQRNNQESTVEPKSEDARDPMAGDERTVDASLITIFRDFFLAAFSDHYQEVRLRCSGVVRVRLIHTFLKPNASRPSPTGILLWSRLNAVPIMLQWIQE